MSMSNILRNCIVHVDGRPKLGEMEECRLPVPEINLDEYRAGGFDAPIDIDLGMKKLDVEYTLFSVDPASMTLFGLYPGNLVPLDIYGHLVGESGASRRVWAHMDCMLIKCDLGTWTPGKRAMLKVHANVRFMQLMHGNQEIYYIDIVNGIRRINGVDITADMRANLGI